MHLSRSIIETKAKFWISSRRVDKWFESKNVFFILGMGRSGTEFFANLLNGDRTAVVFHEPIPDDFAIAAKAHESEQYASEYVATFRKKRMYCLVRNKHVSTYGETTPLLNYFVKPLKELFPNAKFLHLVRDGRDVVRSVMARGHYTGDGVGHHSISPKPDDSLYQQWGKLSRFEKICWRWTDVNRRVRQEVKEFVTFEKLLIDYEYFNKQLESYLDIEVGREQWQDAVQAPRNVTMQHSIPHWTKWDSALTRKFDRICGDEMAQYGY